MNKMPLSIAVNVVVYRSLVGTLNWISLWYKREALFWEGRTCEVY